MKEALIILSVLGILAIIQIGLAKFAIWLNSKFDKKITNKEDL